MTFDKKYITSLLLGTSLTVGGCAGGQTPSTSGLPSGAAPMGAAFVQPQDHQGCQNDGGIQVAPCRITFDANHAGPQDVMVTSNGGGGRNGDGNGNGNKIRESDNCASRNIATVTREAGRIYTVTAGSTTGTCTAAFTQGGGHNNDGGGGQNGGGRLQINNRL